MTRQYPLLLLLMMISASFVSSGGANNNDDDSGSSPTQRKKPTVKCDPGLVPGLFGECVKKTVLPARQTCPDLDPVRFGGHEIQGGGRIAVVWCEEGWTLAPAAAEHVFCKVGRWDREPPRCVRPGCDAVLTDDDDDMLTVTEELGGAIVRFGCRFSSMEVVGGAVLGCDGQRWNGTAPRCAVLSTTTTTTPAPRKRAMARKEEGEGPTSGAASSSSTVMVLLLVSLLLACR